MMLMNMMMMLGGSEGEVMNEMACRAMACCAVVCYVSVGESRKSPAERRRRNRAQHGEPTYWRWLRKQSKAARAAAQR